MDEKDWLAQRFDENRAHLRAVAFRMLGSASEADDAVQEGCLSRTECVKVEDAVDRYLGRDLGLEPSSSA